MTFLYDARYSVVLLRQKIGYTLDPKCSNVDFYGYEEMACTNRRDFISQASERPKTFRFFQRVCLLPMPSLKK